MKTAICAIAKNEDKYIDEWVQYHWKLGIDDVYVFQNNWRYGGSLHEKHNHLGVNHLYLFELDGEVQQLNAYNTFCASFSQMCDWAAFIDVDEFIANNTSRSLKDTLGSFSGCNQIALNWRLLGDSHLHYGGVNNSVTSRFTLGSRVLNHHVKQLVNFKLLRDKRQIPPAFVNPHCTNHFSCTQDGIAFRGPFNENSLDKQQPLELYHYATKTREELHEKVLRGRADTRQTRAAEEDDYFMRHNVNEIPCLAVKTFLERNP